MAASLALHVVIVTPLLISRGSLQQSTPPPPLILLAGTGTRSGVLVDSMAGAPDCALGKAYRGIGLQYDIDRIVIAAPATYPAFQAGIRLGDRVANPEFEPDAQGYATVHILHHGKTRQLRIKSRWICLR